ncbi:hypothetical protein Rhopal_005653-T1 [Rhodotorula paludigena]|uniref:F-box domain-containing protein n=1 Tax=Rhodotorula paludigena TaxID=86838 RepID=A0AAV5GVK4_9BASI|nr:hypothetical protein Rhopal_005653-T1 [Rhodotorula paludigena]
MPSPSLFDRLPDELVDRIFSYVWHSFRAVPTDADPYNDEPDAVPLHFLMLDKRTFRIARPGLRYLAAGRHGENENEMLRRLPSRDEHWAEIDAARVDLVSEWAPAALKRICARATPLTRLVISGDTFELPAKMLVDALRPVERTLRSLTVYAEPAYAQWESPIEYALGNLEALDTFETSSSRWARELIENGVDELRALSVDEPKPDGVFDDLLWDKVEHLRLAADGELACGSDLITDAVAPNLRRLTLDFRFFDRYSRYDYDAQSDRFGVATLELLLDALQHSQLERLDIGQVEQIYWLEDEEDEEDHVRMGSVETLTLSGACHLTSDMLQDLLRFINLFPSLLHLRLTGFDFVPVIDADLAANLDEPHPTLSSLLGTLKERKVVSVVLSGGDGTELRYKRKDAEVDFEGSVWHVDC